MAGAGKDVWGTADQFNYDAASTTGDRTLTARVTGVTNTNALAKAGLMFRQSTAANAAFVMVDVKPGGGIEVLARKTAGAAAVHVGDAKGVVPTASKPVWLKLVRKGSVYSAFFASGTAMPAKWTLVVTVNLTLTTTYLAGLAVTSHDPKTKATGRFDTVGLV